MTGTPDHSSLMPSQRSVAYPRAFLLSIYTAAIEQGFVWINDIEAADHPSLKAQFYRLRRRADTANRSFITPEFHLVTLGAWESTGNGTCGRVPVVFDKLPDGAALPMLTSRDGTPLAQQGIPSAAPPQAPLAAAAAALPAAFPLPADTFGEEGIDDFVSRMAKAAQSRSSDDEQ